MAYVTYVTFIGLAGEKFRGSDIADSSQAKAISPLFGTRARMNDSDCNKPQGIHARPPMWHR